MAGEREQKTLHFKVFLSQTLLPDLHRAEAARGGFAGELRAYEELRDLVLQLQKARWPPLPAELAPGCLRAACMQTWLAGCTHPRVRTTLTGCTHL